MIFTETKLQGAYRIDPKLTHDERGFFGRTFCRDEFARQGLCCEFVQSSISFNIKKGTLRGMHYQKKPHKETKLVACTAGSIYDVVIDLRPKSKTFKQWVGIELSAANHTILYVPEDFAHGFFTLEDNVEVSYHISHPYFPESAAGLRFDDPAFAINWPDTPLVVSERDRSFAWFKAEPPVHGKITPDSTAVKGQDHSCKS